MCVDPLGVDLGPLHVSQRTPFILYVYRCSPLGQFHIVLVPS
jgi:hypothetical protein